MIQNIFFFIKALRKKKYSVSSFDPKFNNFPDIVMKLASYESANHCATRGRTPGFLEFEEIVNTSFEDIRNGGDPASVLGSAESRIESSMRRYQ